MSLISHKRISVKDIGALIYSILPDQGCVEIQRDAAGKEHTWHTHQIDETLIVLEGALRFYWPEGEHIFQEGVVISLPAGTPHGSVAMEGGATYLIAFRPLSF